MQKASEKCRVTQSAVTQSIASLEQELGVKLLERRVRGCFVNDCGVLLLRRVQRMFAQMENALRDLKVPNARTPLSDLASGITRSQIRAALAIAENGSFTKAAQALGMSLSAVGREARDLERLLKVPLYCGSGSGLGMTPSGVRLARRLGLAMREIEMGIREIEAARTNGGGEVVIGATPLVGSIVLRSVISDVVHECPNGTIKVISGSSEDMLRYLRHGDVDFVISLLRKTMPPELVSENLAQTPYLVVAHHGHPLTRKRCVTVDDLARYEWMVGAPHSNRRTCFEKLFEGHRHPKARSTACSLEAMKVLLAQNDYLTLLTSYEYCHDDDKLAPVPFGPVGRVATLGLTMRRNWLPTRVHSNVLKVIRKRVVETRPLMNYSSKERRWVMG